MNEEIMIDFDEKTGKQITFVKSTLWKTKGLGPLSNEVLDESIAGVFEKRRLAKEKVQ